MPSPSCAWVAVDSSRAEAAPHRRPACDQEKEKCRDEEACKMSESDVESSKHPYHLVDPSPWLIVGSIAAGTLTGGLVLYMHNYASWVWPIGVVLLLLTMALWWRDVIREAT